MPSQTTQPQRVLVAPLDWGLGHATRCIPVVETLRRRGCEVLLGAGGPAADLLRSEFPDLRTIPLINYDIAYTSRPLLLALKFPFLVARVFARAGAEHRALERIIDRHGVDAVIADQRFGCSTRRVPCAYISHQLCVKMPRGFGLLERLVWRGLYHAACRYDRLWIPDLPGPDNLTGELSRKYPLPSNHRFIGPLSRFSGTEGGTGGHDLDLLVMLSGPEPQRGLLERRVREQLRSFGGGAVVLLGTPGGGGGTEGGIEYRPHASTAEIGGLLARARAVVCRGGYTTIMELASLGKKALLVPTPGQTEQEYLARHLSARGYFAVERQADFDLGRAMASLDSIEGPPAVTTGTGLLEEALDEWMSV